MSDELKELVRKHQVIAGVVYVWITAIPGMILAVILAVATR